MSGTIFGSFRNDYGAVLDPTVIQPLLLTADAWRHTTASEINGLDVWGQFATYGGGGYVAKLDVSKVISLMILDELKQHRWFVIH